MNEFVDTLDTSFRLILNNSIEQAKSIAISGHVRPDGDCIGSCLAMYNYIQELYNEKKEKLVDVYLEETPDTFLYIPNSSAILHEVKPDLKYDLFISLDCASRDRLGFSGLSFDQAIKTISIDHHISNTQFAMNNYVESEASSTCEVLCGLFLEENISYEVAVALYTGIVHDTGVFKHSNTSRRSMEFAGMLLEKGVSSAEIIDNSFYQKTYKQNQILGRCLLESLLVLSGKCIVSVVSMQQMKFYSAKAHDLEGIIDQLRVTKGVEVAILIHEVSPEEYKVSLRSNGEVNVNTIATYFGGGGHIKAAGCTMEGTGHDVINNLLVHVESQLRSFGILK